jgi:23S rRNA (guanosine2251-2'-O)-methyltransferase
MKIFVIVDNVRSAYNVGSIFRTADGAGSCEILLCGISPTPEHLKVGKTALGATETVAWKYFKTTQEAITYLKEKGIVLGHETEGVNRDILEKSDKIVSIPMRGSKNSLNVASAAAIILYEITRKC